MIKILHLNNYISYTSGVTRYIYNIVKNTKDDFRHEIICFGGDGISLFEELQIKITVKNYSNVLSIPSIYNFLWNYCRKNKIDIVHNHHRFFDMITSMFPGRKFTNITTAHSKLFNWKFLSYRADYLISVSDSITSHLIEHYGKPASRILR
jgi:glycosyltransferase involved in cell wall biosynthesis